MARKKMNPELKAKWLRALRGGKYNQAQHRLKNTRSEYCCLGVLCNISKAGKWVNDKYIFDKGGSENYIPSKLLPIFGLTDKTQKDLSRMNDNTGMSFTQIADWVEANI